MRRFALLFRTTLPFPLTTNVGGREWPAPFRKECALSAFVLLTPRGVLLMGCDQPRLTGELLRALMAAFDASDEKAIVASAYAGAHGVPAVFPPEKFAELRALQGDKGARSIIDQAQGSVVDVEFAGGDVDIDSPDDLAQLG